MCGESDCSEPIHHWFELTYSSYLVVQRSALQTMPVEWQRRFVACLDEMREHLDTDALPSRFSVTARDGDGRILRDPWRDYDRGRRRVPLRTPVEPCPSEVCRFCNRSACLRCGAGCWSAVAISDCPHDAKERHGEPLRE